MHFDETLVGREMTADVGLAREMAEVSVADERDGDQKSDQGEQPQAGRRRYHLVAEAALALRGHGFFAKQHPCHGDAPVRIRQMLLGRCVTAPAGARSATPRRTSSGNAVSRYVPRWHGPRRKVGKTRPAWCCAKRSSSLAGVPAGDCRGQTRAENRIATAPPPHRLR